MPNATWIKIVIGLLAAAMVGLAALTGDSIDREGLQWLGGVTGGIILLLLAFDRWIWRWWGVRWIAEATGSRVVHGTWRGKLNYQDGGEGQPGVQPIYMAVHQTYSTMKIFCFFPESDSESWSLTAAIEPGSHRHVLRYIYRQQAEAPDRDENRATEGVCELRLVGRPVREIVGSYYAERGGKGKIQFDATSRKVAGSAAEASSLPFKMLDGVKNG